MGKSKIRKGVFIRTYDKLKHGFNVIESVDQYVRLPRNPDRIDVVKLSLKWDSVARVLRQIEALAILKSRLAGLVLRLDDEGILDTDSRGWPATVSPD